MTRIDEARRRVAEHGKGVADTAAEIPAIEEDEADLHLAALAREPFPMEMPVRRAPRSADADAPRESEMGREGAAAVSPPSVSAVRMALGSQAGSQKVGPADAVRPAR